MLCFLARPEILFLFLFPAFSLAQNLVVNPGFENGMENWRWINSRNARASGKVDTKIFHTGKASYRITNASKLSPYVYCEIYQEVKVKPNTTYQISAWCKGLGASWVRLQGDYKWTFTRPAPEGDFDWVLLSGTHTTGPEQTMLPIMLHVESATQAVWVDDIEVVELGEAQKYPNFYVRPNREKILGTDRFSVARNEKFRDQTPVVQFRDQADKSFGADVRTAWNEKGLILGIGVKDTTPGPAGTGSEMFIQDCIQVGIDTNPGSDKITSGYANTSFELGFSLLPSGKVDQFAWQPGNYDFGGVVASGKRMQDGYRLEILLPWRNLGIDPAKIPDWIALNVLVNEGGGGRRWVAWTPGIGEGKNPNEYALVALGDKKSKEISTGRIILDKPVGTIYDHQDTIVGRFLEMAIEPLPEQTVSLTATLDRGQVKILGQVLLPKTAMGGIRQFDFVIPAAVLDQEGKYVLSVSSRNTAPVKPVIRTNLKTRVKAKIEELTKRTGKLEQRLKDEPQFAKDAYVGMGVPLAKRFIGQVKAGGWDGKQGLDWDMMQLEEVEWVLDQTDQRLAKLSKGKVKVWEQVNVQPGTVRIQDGIFYAKPVGGDTDRPFYLGGYDEWDKLVIDLDFLHKVGMNIVQQDAWPRLMKPDGSLEYLGAPSATGPQILPRNIDTFAANGVLVDVILCLHVVPDWLSGQIPGMNEVVGAGWLSSNVDHPEVRKFLKHWIEILVSGVKDKPGLFGFCLTNEPSYGNSGRDKFSRPRWIEFLKKQHKTLQNLNELYQKNYNTFDEIPVPPLPKAISELPKEIPGLRAYYDWMTFNHMNFADFHRWVHENIKRVAPRARTHTKIMPLIFDRSTVFMGIDPELITDITDLAGNDSFGKWMWTPGGEYVFHWQEEMAWYELLHSFGGKPVFNSENHLIDTDLPPIHIPTGYTQTEVWQSALHHLWTSVVWTWEVFPPNESATIYRRPANIYAVGQATFDLNRLAPEALAVTNQPAQIAILYSMNSVFWSEDCSSLLAPIFTAGSFLGQPVTFVSERQLAEGKVPKNIKWIILPHATHVASTTVKALDGFVTNGGKIVRVGDHCLFWDEYHRKNNLPEWVEKTPLITLPANEKQINIQLRSAFEAGGLKPVSLIDLRINKPAWGVEYRVLPYGKKTLVPLLNFLNKPLSVRLEMKGTAVDLLTGEPVNLSAIELEPVKPRLLEIQP